MQARESRPYIGGRQDNLRTPSREYGAPGGRLEESEQEPRSQEIAPRPYKAQPLVIPIENRLTQDLWPPAASHVAQAPWQVGEPARPSRASGASWLAALPAAG